MWWRLLGIKKLFHRQDRMVTINFLGVFGCTLRDGQKTTTIVNGINYEISMRKLLSGSFGVTIKEIE